MYNKTITLANGVIVPQLALMAQGITDSSLKFHIQNAKNHAVTQKEMTAAITHVAFTQDGRRLGQYSILQKRSIQSLSPCIQGYKNL